VFTEQGGWGRQEGSPADSVFRGVGVCKVTSYTLYAIPRLSLSIPAGGDSKGSVKCEQNELVCEMCGAEGSGCESIFRAIASVCECV